MNKHIAFGVSLLALSLVTAGCIEAKQDFEVHGNGSGIVTLEFKLGKELSAKAAADLKGKEQADLDKMAAAEMGDQFKGVYWEKFTQKIDGDHVVLSATGVFADINQVKMVSEDAGMGLEEGEAPAQKEQLAFVFEQTDEGGKLTMKMDSGQGGMPGGGMEGMGEDEEFAKEMKKAMEQMLKPMLEQLKGFKFRISAKVPGEVSKSTLQDLGEGRHGIEISVKTIEEQALQGKAGTDGTVEWKGKKEAPSDFAARIAKAKEAWEAGAKEREELRKKIAAEKAESGDMDLEELEKKLKEAEKGLEEPEGGEGD